MMNHNAKRIRLVFSLFIFRPSMMGYQTLTDGSAAPTPMVERISNSAASDITSFQFLKNVTPGRHENLVNPRKFYGTELTLPTGQGAERH
jgi:hypothetical protein